MTAIRGGGRSAAALAVGALVAAAAGVGGDARAAADQGLRIEFEAVVGTIDASAEAASPRAGSSDSAPQEGESPEVGLRFRLFDQNSREAVSGAWPMAWVLRRSEAQAGAGAVSCEHRVKRLLRDVATASLTADMGGFSLVIANAEGSISLLNPAVRVGSANLEAMIPLDGRIHDWAVDRKRGRVFATLPDAARVVVVDVHGRRVARRIAIGGQPRQIVVGGDGRHAWVGVDGEQRVVAIDAQTLETVKSFALEGEGSVVLALHSQSQSALLMAEKGSSMLLVDARSLTARRIDAPSAGIDRIAHSSLAAAYYALDRDTGKLFRIDERSGASQSLPLSGEPLPMSTMKISPDGRWLVALAKRGPALIVDLVSDRLVRAVPVGAAPDHVDFSREFAYVRSAGSNRVSLIPLRNLDRDAELAVTTIEAGTRAAEDDERGLSHASPIAIMPSQSGAMLVGTADRTIYHYVEGMNAPMNSLKARGGVPLGVLMVDRRPREIAQRGVYEARARLDPGVYDVAFFSDTPRAVGCFDFLVPGERNGDEPGPRPVLRHRWDERAIAAGRPTRLSFQILDRRSGRELPPAQDVRVLAMRTDGRWQMRASARPDGDGYRTEVHFPSPGDYRVILQSGELGIRATDRDFHALLTASDDMEGE